MSMLTEHFSDNELGVNELPSEDYKRTNALILCRDILEPARIKLGPLNIHDGYRDLAHNIRVGGVTDSFHLYLEDESAADFTPDNYNIKSAFDWIRLGSNLNFDKVILELNKKTLVPVNIHIQYYTMNKNKNRRQAFEGFTSNQGSYIEVAVI